VRVLQPMVLGHEIAGVVAAVGGAVTRVKVGDAVAVNPSLACNTCRYCLEGAQQHCLDMRFFGSAMRNPHVQGGLREQLVCHESQAVVAAMPSERAAFAEPLSVCLHAVRQAGAVLGRRVLVTGAGPIGVLCAMVARHAGAREVVVTDLLDAPLAVARKLAADRTVNVGAEPAAMAEYGREKGYFDVAFEASGSGIAVAAAVAALRPGGTLVQVGNGGAQTEVPLNSVVAKEITLRGTFRFHAEFAMAVELLARNAIDVAPLLTEIVPIDDAVRAFDLATDRKRAMKVQISL
jgi:L-idonate 5-dehydrogenase